MRSSPLRRPLIPLAVSAALVAGVALVPPAVAAQPRATATTTAPASGVMASTAPAAAAPTSRKPIPAGKCARNGGVIGIASLAGKRVEGGTVSVLIRPKNQRGWYSVKQRLQGSSVTNKAGGFYVKAACLPEIFLVSVTGGTINGKPFKGTLTTLGRASELGVILTPITTVAAQYARTHPGVSPQRVFGRVKAYFDLVDYGNGLMDLGMGSLVISSRFDPAALMRSVDRAGGLGSFARTMAGRIGEGRTRSFAPKDYEPPSRPGYAPAPDGPPSAASQASSRSVQPRGGLSSTLSSMAGKTMVAETCKALGPSIASDLSGVCPPDYSSELDAIEQSLQEISSQLDTLQTSVDEIQTTLDAMTAQLNEIQATVDEILDLDLKNEADTAQQNYATAYNNSEAVQVNGLVTEALGAVQILGSLQPSGDDTWQVIPATATDAEVCLTQYPNDEVTTGEYAGQDPYTACTTYAANVQAFADGSNGYNMKLYQALTGAQGTPQDDLLAYTQQQALTNAGNSPISQEMLAESFDQMGQLGQMMDIGYAMLGSWQTFWYAVTSGKVAVCPELIVSGTFPATQEIDTSFACGTVQTGLFMAAVQNQVASRASLPPEGSIADPRTNYVWWGYPIDVSGGSVLSSKPYRMQIFPMEDGSDPYNKAFGDATSGPWLGYFLPSLRGVTMYTELGPPQPLLQASTQAEFGRATPDELLTLFEGLPLTSGQTYANVLNAIGFRGLGQSHYGMNWNYLAYELGWNDYFSVNDWNQAWNTSTNGDYSPECPGWPNNGFDFDYVDDCWVQAVLTQQMWNLASTTQPTSSNVANCPGSLSVLRPGDIWACQADTFTLLVNNQYSPPGATSGGWPPPFFTVGMLNGPSSSGVPALPLS